MNDQEKSGRLEHLFKLPILYLWDKFELDPALALALFVVLAYVLSYLAYFSLWFMVLPAMIFGYVIIVVAWAIWDGSGT